MSIYGFGGFATFFAQPALTALAVALLVITVAAIFAGGGLSIGEREDRSNRWVLIPFAVIGLALGFVPAYTDRIGFLTIDGDAVPWLGVVLFAIGGALRIWPVYVLAPSKRPGVAFCERAHALPIARRAGT
ncbi:MAG: hypothetical protein WB609_01485 [Candidatus Cybelea sp.]